MGKKTTEAGRLNMFKYLKYDDVQKTVIIDIITESWIETNNAPFKDRIIGTVSKIYTSISKKLNLAKEYGILPNHNFLQILNFEDKQYTYYWMKLFWKNNESNIDKSIEAIWNSVNAMSVDINDAFSMTDIRIKTAFLDYFGCTIPTKGAIQNLCAWFVDINNYNTENGAFMISIGSMRGLWENLITKTKNSDYTFNPPNTKIISISESSCKNPFYQSISLEEYIETYEISVLEIIKRGATCIFFLNSTDPIKFKIMAKLTEKIQPAYFIYLEYDEDYQLNIQNEDLKQVVFNIMSNYTIVQPRIPLSNWSDKNYWFTIYRRKNQMH